MLDVMPMPARTIQPLDHLASGVAGLRTVMVNLFAISSPNGSWALIDTGLPLSSNRILHWIERHKGADARPTCILLTHGHFDHTGALESLAERWDVPVYAHALEMPYLTGKSKYPPPDPTVGGGAFTLLAPLYPRGPIDIHRRLRELPADGAVPGLDDWRWIATPGHSPGHVSFFRESDRVLIAGDAFTTTKQESVLAVMTQRPELHGPPAYYTVDWDAAKLSVGRLAGLQPNVIACGHGLPMDGPEVQSALDYLAEHFDLVARPAQGRYVRNPAITDENGIVQLPPPVVSPAFKIALGVALAGGLAYAFAHRRRS
ncbi:MAG TPA: MBL fold metallo-hydrolase [Bryobacteraceae bacterium]|nr:MBL fold metallo-hydrolase [Bryobacteraceae bacterium]